MAGSLAPLPPYAPVAPDFHVCDQNYGDLLKASDCLSVIERLPRGDTPIAYTHNGWSSGGFNDLPVYSSVAGCQLSVELAGPGVGYRSSHTFMIAPDRIRAMASYLLDNCINDWGGVGGFVTERFINLVNYITSPGFNLGAPFPASSLFLTVTMSQSQSRPAPGDGDPRIPLALGLHLADKEENAAGRSTDDSLSSKFLQISAAMDTFVVASNTEMWWDYLPSSSSSSSDDMTYECDAKLGSPHPVDCSKLEYFQLGAEADKIQISQHVPKILSSGTCDVAVSSSFATIITWDAIRAALNTLVNFCVESPYHSSTGGTAYYGHHIVPPKTNRKRATKVSGKLPILSVGSSIEMIAPLTPKP